MAESPVAASRLALTRARNAATSHGVFTSIAASPWTAPAGSGPLAGVPFAVKDNIDTSDLPTSGGTALLSASVPMADADVVRVLRQAGASVLGKANLHELALGVTSDNATFGPVRNPADPRRSAGGSSGGSAAAVALGLVPFALGTDTGGSMTIPAAVCGVVGFRPSSGCYPGGGVLNISSTRDTVGVMATSVHDVRLVDGILRFGQRKSAARSSGALRLGIPTRYRDDLDASINEAFTRVLGLLAKEGLVLEPIDLDDVIDSAGLHGFSVVAAEALPDIARYLAGLGGAHACLTVDELVDQVRSPDVRALLVQLRDRPPAPSVYADALHERRRLRNRLRATMSARRLDALIYPTTAVLPALVGEEFVSHRGAELPIFPALTRHTEAGSFAGSPSISLPIGTSESPLPVGLTLEGPPHGDLSLLATAARVEAALSRVPVP